MRAKLPGRSANFAGLLGRGDHLGHAAARETVEQILAVEQRSRGNEHGAEFHGRQHHLPQRRHIAEHEQDAVAALDAERAQEVGRAVRAHPHLRERRLEFRTVLVDDPQRRPRIALGHAVEIIERPIEALRLRPAEIATGRLAILAMPQQEVARGDEFLGGARLFFCHADPPEARRPEESASLGAPVPSVAPMSMAGKRASRRVNSRFFGMSELRNDSASAWSRVDADFVSLAHHKQPAQSPLGLPAASGVQLRRRRASRSSVVSPSKSLGVSTSCDRSTSSNVFTLTTAYRVSSITHVATGITPHVTQT